MTILFSALLLASTVAQANDKGTQDPNDRPISGASPGVIGFDCDGVCQRNLSGGGLFKKRSYDNLLEGSEGASKSESDKTGKTDSAN